MAEQLISGFVDRAGFAADGKFAVDILSDVEKAYLKLDTILNTGIGGKGAKDVASTITATAAASKELTGAISQQTTAINANAAAAEKAHKTKGTTKQLEDDVTKAAKKLSSALSEQNVELQGFKVQTEAANKAAKEQAKEQLGLITVYDTSKKRLEAIKNELKALSVEGKENTSEFKALQVEFKALDGVVRKAEQGVGEFQRNVGNYSGAVSVLKDSFEEVAAKLEKFKNEGTASEQVLNALQKEFDLLNKLVNSQEAGFANATQEIRANQRALLDLENAGLKGSEAYNKLAQSTGDLKDQVADLTQRTKNLGSDTFVFDGLIGAAEGLTSAYGAAQAATELFGGSGEELQKVFVKLQAVQTLLASLQAIRNVLQAESSTLLSLETRRTKAAAIAQGVYAVAVGSSTGAMKAFRVALLATGIGAIIGLLALAADAMGVFDSETDAATLSIEEQTKALEKQRESLTAVINETDKARNRQAGGLNDLKRELALSEARGDSEKKIASIKDQIFQKETFNRRVSFETFKGDSEKQIEIAEEQKDAQNAFEAEKLSAAKKANEDSVKSAQDAANKRTKAAEEEAKRLAALRERDIKAYFELNQLRLEDQIKYYEASANNDKLSAEQRAVALINQTELEQRLIKAKADLQLRQEGLTANEILLIERKRDSEILANAVSFNDKLAAINEAAKEKAKQAAEDRKVGTLEGPISSDLPQFIKDIDTKNQITIDKAKKLNDEKLALEKQFNEKVKELGLESLDTIQTFVNASFDTKKNLIQDEIDAVEKQKQADIDRVNATTISEQDKAAKLTSINIKAQADREALERRQREIDQKKAAFEKAFNIARIISATAIAVIGALAPPPAGAGPIAGIPLAAVIGAIGALQIAQVLATPIPKFRTGKTGSYEGPAIVGDGGVPEYIYRADGSIEKTPAKDTLTYLGSKDIVFPDQLALLKAFAMPTFSNVINQPKDNGSEKIVNRLAALENAIMGKTENHFHWDNGQLIKSQKNGQAFTEWVSRST